MSNSITASTWAEINLDNIKFNLKNIKSLLKKDTKVCGVVKANAYGHGAVQISKLLERENVDYLAVSRLEEALELRENGISIPILCLGYIPECSLEDAVVNDISLTVFSYETASIVNEFGKKHNRLGKIHIKIDTGMGRIGLKVNDESVDEIIKINSLDNLLIEGIFTHFATADEKNKTYTYNQAQKFNSVINRLENLGIEIPIKHVSNSAAIMECRDLNFNMVRCGIILYGHYPSDEVNKEVLNIKPAMTLKSRVSYIKELSANMGISYGLKYKTKLNERIVTIPIGYADGFTRMQKNPKVYIKNQEFDVVGRICMDQCMAKIDKEIDIKIGDEVIIFSESKNQCVEKLANDLGTINYEILCMVARRVERVYMERNAIVQRDNYLIK
ncbi:alanine racemase [[Clostridium] sordellii]|uniref:alanine racemase n=1 Tax=Paraclostridium sordellii TaxID=1505 RepID=UPI0002F8099A|nr:alanine racemase [Paeniclostridium sordellii]TAN69216.1 alanine racemase [Paeniclostridium sordellii 8483]CEK32528.1 alanine racemase [[Clostridium] sordellii] [Paeniclostridium sordellii]